MADAAILAASLLNPSSPPNRPVLRQNPNPNPNPKPLLSNVRRDLTSSPRLLKYYARLANKLAGEGKLRDFLMIAESVLTSEVVSRESPQFVAKVDARMVAAGVCEALREGKLDEVIEFLDGARKLGISPGSLFGKEVRRLLAAVCRGFMEEGRLEELVELVETLAGYGFYIKDIIDPVDIVKLFVGKSDLDMAVRFASIYPHSQFLFCTIIEEFGKRQDIISSMRAYEASREESGGFNMFACRSIIDVCGCCGDFLKSRSIIEELLAQKVTPNVYVFNSLMNVNAHDLGYILHVYKHMQNLGVTMDITSYNILLKACCNAKRVDLAQDIYKEVKHMASERGLRLDVITYSTMIKVFADAKMWQMALSIKEDMLLANVTPNIVTWSSLINACANAGLLDNAIQLFEEMLVAGCEPNAQCCNVLLYACVKSCQFDRAFRYFYCWKESGIKVSGVIKGIVKWVTFRPTIATFNILMKGCGTDHHRAKALMDEMKTIGLSPNHITWSILIDIYGSSQNMKGALEAFRTMQNIGIKLDVVAYTAAIKACVENKKLNLAFSLFDEMKKNQLRPNLVTYNTLLRARRRYGSLHEVQQCLAIYQEMRKAGYSANDYYLKELIEEWCEGVICSNQNSSLVGIQQKNKIIHSKNAHGLLLEKVAAHLRKDGDNHAIDIRGLTQVEARIVVLSVLWKIRENYRTTRKMVQEDMVIISGAGTEVAGSPNHELRVQRAILKVLRDELNLNVSARVGRVTEDAEHSILGDASSPAIDQTVETLTDRKHLARRPQDLGVLKVSRESLCDWLKKRGGS